MVFMFYEFQRIEMDILVDAVILSSSILFHFLYFFNRFYLGSSKDTLYFSKVTGKTFLYQINAALIIRNMKHKKNNNN